jgi:hypothetical protein
MIDHLTAEQNIRLTLTGSPFGEPHFQHEGDNVVRWLTGGTDPDLHVFFQTQDDLIQVRCAQCTQILGTISTVRDTDTGSQIGNMRRTHGPIHQKSAR